MRSLCTYRWLALTGRVSTGIEDVHDGLKPPLVNNMNEKETRKLYKDTLPYFNHLVAT